MTRYAAQTDVTPEKSRAEVERILVRYGATAFHYGWEGDRVMIGFALQKRYFKIVLPMPAKNDREFHFTRERGIQRHPQAALEAWEQACKQRWRALALWIKAVLEATESGITTLEEALLPFILLPDKSTVREWLLPQVAQAYETGHMPQLLPALTDPGDNP
jgi:hypothetical protein